VFSRIRNLAWECCRGSVIFSVDMYSVVWLWMVSDSGECF
jgi:hypothetical protein